MGEPDFTNPAVRKQSLAQLKSGGSEDLLKRITRAYRLYTDAIVSDILWMFTDSRPEVVKLGMALFKNSTDTEKVQQLFNSFKQASDKETSQAYLSVLSYGGGSELFAHLGKMLNNSNLQMRKEAVNVLVRLKNWHTHRALVESLLSDPDIGIRKAVLSSVINNSSKSYAGHLRMLAETDEDDAIRESSLTALISMNNTVNTVVLFERLPFENKGFQEKIFNALLTFVLRKPDEVKEHIFQSVISATPEVRKAATYFFLQFENQIDAFCSLLDYCEGISSSYRDLVFVEADMHKALFTEFVIYVLKNDKSDKRRLMAIRLAATLKHPKLAEMFLQELASKDWVVKCTAMRALGEMKSPKAVPILLKALSDTDYSVAAIQAIGCYRDLRLAKELFRKLGNSTETEQMEIVKVLGDISDKRFIEPIINFIASDKSSDRSREVAIGTVIRICEKNKLAIPDKIDEIKKKKEAEKLAALPDLNLKLVDEQ